MIPHHFSILSKEPEFKTYVSRFHCTLHASQAGITCVFLRNNVSSVLKLLDLKNPFSPFPSFQSLSSIPPLQFQLCVPAFPKAQPIPYSACHNSALSFPNISFTLQTTLRSRFPTFHSLRLFCVPPSPTLLPGTLLSLINITRTSFSTLSPHPSAHFFSPYLETPFCSPNHYPRMPNTPPSSSNPALFPPPPRPCRLKPLLLPLPDPQLQSTHYLSFPPTFRLPLYPRFSDSSLPS